MFSPAPTSKLAQRALGALRVARSILLLEDDYAVDWEVGQDERARVSHPHRAALRGGCAERRAGQSPARPQACLSPVGSTAHKHPRTCLRRDVAPWSCACDAHAAAASSSITPDH
jgi:hypothetical protein